MFETNQEKAKEMPNQKQGQEKATLYKQCQRLAAGFWKRRDIHGLMEIFNFWTKAA
jgi:hypothetical protein